MCWDHLCGESLGIRWPPPTEWWGGSIANVRSAQGFRARVQEVCSQRKFRSLYEPIRVYYTSTLRSFGGHCNDCHCNSCHCNESHCNDGFVFTSCSCSFWGTSRTKASFSHLQHAAFERRLARKLRFHIFNLQFLSLARKFHFPIFNFQFSKEFSHESFVFTSSTIRFWWVSRAKCVFWEREREFELWSLVAGAAVPLQGALSALCALELAGAAARCHGGLSECCLCFAARCLPLTQKLLHREVSAQRNFCTQKLLHKHFTQRSLYTQKF